VKLDVIVKLECSTSGSIFNSIHHFLLLVFHLVVFNTSTCLRHFFLFF
jgi:hypothetical protein